MSTRQDGNRRENRCARILEKRGYHCFPSRGSRGIDLFCVHATDRAAPHLAIEVGGRCKVISSALAALRAAPKPGGTVCLVARWLSPGGRRPFFRWHLAEGDFVDDVDRALERVRSI